MIHEINRFSICYFCDFCFSQYKLLKSQKDPPGSGTGRCGSHTKEYRTIKAPFPMSQLQRPSFPDKEYSITDFGATEGSTSKVTQAIQQAIDQASGNGGGKVIVPAGKWLSGRIHLKSNVNLYISKGAELHFSGEMKDYRPPVFCRIESLELYSLGALIYAHKEENIGITGKGTLYGPESGPVREIVLHTVSDSIVSWKTPVQERIYDGIAHKIYFRPYFISPVDCRNVLIEGLTLRNGPMWNVVPVYCENVIIRGMRVESVGVGNGDGINIESCRNVLVEYCTVNTGDDCYCMKAGRNQDGVRVNKPVENVILRYCSSEGGHGGITFGSETAGQMRNVYVHDCVFENNNIGIRFKTRRPRAGGGENLTIENIRLNVKKNAMEWDMLGLSIWVGNLANRLPAPPVTPLTPFYRDITIRNVAGHAGRHVLKMEGLPGTSG